MFFFSEESEVYSFVNVENIYDIMCDVIYIQFPETHVIAGTRAGTHASKFTCAIYRTREIIVFSFLLLYISCKEEFFIEGFFIEPN